MFTESFYNIILNLTEDWVVEHVETDVVKGEVSIQISFVGNQYLDEDSGLVCKLYDHAPSRRWRHLDTLQYRTYLVCRLPRIQCADGKVKTVNPPWASGHERHSYLFEHVVIDLLKATKNQTATANLIGCTFNVVNRILHLSTRRGEARRQLSDASFTQISIDEKSFQKGHKYITVVSDPTTGCVIDVGQDRTKDSCKALLEKAFTEKQRKNITSISMDMWPAFISSSQENLPNAAITHDRFHLIKYLNEAIDKVRRREVKTNEELKKSRYALLKNPENLTETQRIKFDAISNANYEVSKAWQVRENFKDLFSSNINEAFCLYMKWAADAMARNIQEVSKVATMFNNHLAGVVNALVNKISNAMAERLNGKIQEIKTIGKGYRTFQNFRSAILFFHAGLDLYPLK